MTWVEKARILRPYIEKAVKSLSDEDALQAVTLYPAWRPDENYDEIGFRVRFEDILYKVLQPHTSQANWLPSETPSLYAKVLIPEPDIIYDWEQPDSTNPYMKGDKVRYNNLIWESIIDNNVWQPGVYGWTVVIE